MSYDISKAKRGPSHREYVLDRANKIATMFNELRDSNSLCEKFFSDPEVVATRYGVTLSDEEVFAIKAGRNIELTNLRERLVINPVAFFDANCSCSLFDKGFISLPSERR